MSDGLSQLAQRGRRTRDIPPPRNPARAEPVRLSPAPDQALQPEPGAPTAPAPAPDPQPAPAPAVTPRNRTEPPRRGAKNEPRPAVQAAPLSADRTAGKAALKVVTIYLEQDDDDFLETITHTGRTSQPKTAISRSAVVRLALERLHAQMTPAQIVDELRPRGDQLGTGTGRKRR